MAAKKSNEVINVEVETKEVEGTVTTVTEVKKEKIGLVKRAKNGWDKFSESKVGKFVKPVLGAGALIGAGVIGYALGSKDQITVEEISNYMDLNEIDLGTED